MQRDVGRARQTAIYLPDWPVGVRPCPSQDMELLRRATRLPIVLKGILHPEDARAAVDRGVSALIVSNHEGRQVDGAIASLDALPSVVDAVRSRVPVLLDSGVRGGGDVFKALALGARAVCLGRPYVYALALAGEAGVRELGPFALASVSKPPT